MLSVEKLSVLNSGKFKLKSDSLYVCISIYNTGNTGCLYYISNNLIVMSNREKYVHEESVHSIVLV